MPKTLEIQNTPLLVWYFLYGIEANLLLKYPGMQNAQNLHFVHIALSHSQDTPKGQGITKIATWHLVECDYKLGVTTD